MIIEIRAKNCFSFEKQIVFSMEADMRNKKFSTNVHRENICNILKTAGIYGPNNSGKTCFIKCIETIKNVLLNKNPRVMTNIFTHNPVCELGVTFLSFGRKFSYDFFYDLKEDEFVYEKFAEITKDKYGNEKENVWILKDNTNKRYTFADEGMHQMISLMAQNNIICYIVDTKQFKHLDEMKKIITEFANKIDIVNMNNIPMKKTIDLMKNKNDLQNKIVDFIKNADLYMDDFGYADIDELNIRFNGKEDCPDEKVLDRKEELMDRIRLVSTYKGVPLPSILFDSTGTKKIAALASYIIEGIEQGRILVVDELDSSIHFKLTRAIVAMYNNELNTSAQMIFTIHDINLMDCKKMFRKEQIWFMHKDYERVYMYSLAAFTAQQGIRGTTDIIEKYRKGALGALPDPNLINTLLNVKGYKKEVNADEV